MPKVGIRLLINVTLFVDLFYHCIVLAATFISSSHYMIRESARDGTSH